MRCQVLPPSLKAHLSVQTVNMCSKYIEVISRESEFLIPIIDNGDVYFIYMYSIDHPICTAITFPGRYLMASGLS